MGNPNLIYPFLLVMMLIPCQAIFPNLFGTDTGQLEHVPSISTIIRSRGYQCSTHFVTTPDGYILQLDRINNQYCDKYNVTRKGTVLLMPGIMLSAADWVVHSSGGFPDDSQSSHGNNLGFELSKRGYDVWLGNLRGNIYSRNHRSLNHLSPSFWDFSLDEMIKYDLPTIVDYVLKKTKRKTLAYIGHSAGSTIMFGAMASMKRFNYIIRPFIGLAAGTSFDHAIPDQYRFKLVPSAARLMALYPGPFAPNNLMQSGVCGQMSQPLCERHFYSLTDMDPRNVDQSKLKVYRRFFPAGTSKKVMAQYAINSYKRKFQMYDYGRIKNWLRYGYPDPPIYDLRKVTNPTIVLMNAIDDSYSKREDIEKLKMQLGVRVASDRVVTRPGFRHNDFFWANTAGSDVNKFICQTLHKYSSH